jgi:ABC-type lipoprotein export system ATPase subunit
MAPLVSCREASRIYGASPTPALRPVTCDVNCDDRIAIVGPSGSGKSTLLHLMAGLDTPSEGLVTWPAIGDIDALRPGPIGMVFQGASLLPPLTVIENAALPLLLAGAQPAAATTAADAVLSLLGLRGLAAKLPEELSGGQAQRVAIARALVGGPRLILADEPTSQLDAHAAAHVIDVLLDAADSASAALVIATHDAAIAARLEHCWSISDGLLASDRSFA